MSYEKEFEKKLNRKVLKTLTKIAVVDLRIARQVGSYPIESTTVSPVLVIQYHWQYDVYSFSTPDCTGMGMLPEEFAIEFLAGIYDVKNLFSNNSQNKSITGS